MTLHANIKKSSLPMVLWLTLLSALFLCTSCSSLLYYPTQVVHYDPSQLKLVPENIEIEVESQVKIHGWYFKSPNKPKAVLVFFHGNAENITSHYVSLAWILKEGYDYFIWDYRGYGKSQGKPNPKNTMEDGKKVIQHIYERNPKLPLIVFAQSLGGAIAMRSAIEVKEQVPMRAVVVDSTFQSYQSVAANVLSRHWLTWLFQPLAYVVLSDRYTAENRIDEISPIPLLVMHGTNDTIIDYKFGKEVFEDAKDPKEFWTIENGNHINSFWGPRGDEIRKKFLGYLDRLLKK